MPRSRTGSIALIGLILSCLLFACTHSPQATTPMVNSAPTSVPDLPGNTTAIAVVEASPTTSISPTATAFPCGEDWCVYSGHFLLQRPIASSGERRIEQTYAFGSTQGGKREVHHGVEFNNPIGTPVLAVGDGTVVYAGDDLTVEYGWWLDFYGNLILIRHDLPVFSQPVYSLYGHLSKLDVQTGDNVTAGEKIGEVGAEGKAIGAHLHFEIRLGGSSYDDVRNPMLWIKPLAGEGVLVGSILNSAGEMVYAQGLTVKSKGSKTWYPEVYGDPQLGSDADLNENFVLSDLPAGDYTVTYSPYGIPYTKVITIYPGLVTKVTFTLNR